MQKRAAGRGNAARGALEILAAEHGSFRNDAIVQDLFFGVDVLQEHLEGAEALADSAGEGVPFGRSENLREQVAKPTAFAPREFSVDVEGHAHLAHGRLKPGVERANFVAGHAVQALEEVAIDIAR